MKEELNPAGILHKGGSDIQRRQRRRERGIKAGKSKGDGCQVTAGSAIDNGKCHVSIELREYGAVDESVRYTEVRDDADPRATLYALPEEPVVGGYVVSTLADSLGSLCVEELEALRDGAVRHKK